MRASYRHTFFVNAAVLIGCFVTSTLAQDVPLCGKDEAQPVCIQRFGQVSVQLESPDGHSIRRAIIFSDNMKRDAHDFTIAAGLLMMALNPASTPDQRRELLDEMLRASARRKVKVWSGYVWQLARSDTNEAIRIIAERGTSSVQNEPQIKAAPPSPTAGANSEMSVRSATAVCAAVDATHLASEPCGVSGWHSSINVRIDMNSAEARKACAGIVALSAQMGAKLDASWTVQIYSPYSGDHPIATCSF